VNDLKVILQRLGWSDQLIEAFIDESQTDDPVSTVFQDSLSEIVDVVEINLTGVEPRINSATTLLVGSYKTLA